MWASHLRTAVRTYLSPERLSQIGPGVRGAGREPIAAGARAIPAPVPRVPWLRHRSRPAHHPGLQRPPHLCALGDRDSRFDHRTRLPHARSPRPSRFAAEIKRDGRGESRRCLPRRAPAGTEGHDGSAGRQRVELQAILPQFGRTSTNAQGGFVAPLAAAGQIICRAPDETALPRQQAARTRPAALESPSPSTTRQGRALAAPEHRRPHRLLHMACPPTAAGDGEVLTPRSRRSSTPL
jgi:hypothetical protein